MILSLKSPKVGGLALSLALVSAFPAFAQDATGADVRARNWVFSGTVGVAYAPDYEGSNNSSAAPILDFSVESADGLYFAGLGGIGIAPIRSDTASLSFALAYGGEREVSDDPINLAGLGDIDGEALLLVAGEYYLGPVSLGADVTAGDNYGATVDFTIGSAIPISSRLTLAGGVTGRWANSDHSQTYFGVTSAQAAASGKSAFTSDSGFNSAGVSVGLDFAINEKTSVSLGIDYTRLQGDAARSPISVKDEQFSVAVGISRTF